MTGGTIDNTNLGTGKYKKAQNNGGAVYLSDPKGAVKISGGTIQNASAELGGAVYMTHGTVNMSVGGHVNIGDVGDDGTENNTASAAGNIFIQSPMLVKGGDVKIYGNTDNPKFADKILVDMRKDAGSFEDNRLTKLDETDINYKIEFFENFEDSGAFTSMQYKSDDEIRAIGNMYEHEGYKIVGWDTQKDGKGTVYSAKYKDSKMTSEDGVTIPLYAQWVDCTHLGNEHPGTLRYTGDFLTEKPQIAYEYKAEKDSTYSGLTGVPTEKGYYKASITVENLTVSVEYQIKSPAEAASIDVTANKGQHFSGFQGSDTCSVQADDAFTVQYDVQELNKGTNADSQQAYASAPVLTFDQTLPVGTSIIMQTKDTYYWYTQDSAQTGTSGQTIALTSFHKMGSEAASFIYDTSNISNTQQYRFMVDFSDAEETPNTSLNVGLKYEYNKVAGTTGTNNDLTRNASITVGDKYQFSIQKDGNQYKIAAPSSVNQTRWERKNLVWKIKAADVAEHLPADAKLTVSTTENQQVKTTVSTINNNEEFIIPFTWTGEQSFTFALSSNQETTGNKTYNLTATLCVGSKIDKASQPAAQEDSLQKASSEIELLVPQASALALKISGASGTTPEKRVFSKTEDLKVQIAYENIAAGSVIQSVIQKKTENGYGGEFYKATIDKQGIYTYALSSTEDAGSYRLLVTVSTQSGQKLLEVPYYFIVK